MNYELGTRNDELGTRNDERAAILGLEEVSSFEVRKR